MRICFCQSVASEPLSPSRAELTDVALELRDLKKTYVGPDGSAVPVIDVDRLDVSDNEQVAMIGTSGSGKTTLLHLIAGIVAPDSGQILYRLQAPGLVAG